MVIASRNRRLQRLAVVRTDARQPIADTRALQRLANQRAPKESPFFKPENAPSEVQQAMAAYIQNYEQEWLDLPVPALSGPDPASGGRRPDPARRPRTAAGPDRPRRRPIDMSARRLRVALGLEHA